MAENMTEVRSCSVSALFLLVFARFSAHSSAHFLQVMFTDGVFVFHEGDSGESLFMIDQGSVGVYIEGKGKVTEVEQGRCFGELALINHEPRTASVRAQGTTKLLELTTRSVEPILNRIWGGQKEMARRMSLLLRIPIFQYLERDAMQLLATILSSVKYAEPGAGFFSLSFPAFFALFSRSLFLEFFALFSHILLFFSLSLFRSLFRSLFCRCGHRDGRQDGRLHVRYRRGTYAGTDSHKLTLI